MKKLIAILVIVSVAVLYWYPFEADSTLYSIQSSFKSIGKSEDDYRKELEQKLDELDRYEDMIERITVEFERTAANTPICPKTGQRIEIEMTNDPRPGLQEKCDVLLAEIEVLEAKLDKYQ